MNKNNPKPSETENKIIKAARLAARGAKKPPRVETVLDAARRHPNFQFQERTSK